MSDTIRILSLGFSSTELQMMQVVLDAMGRTLDQPFRLVRASEAADVAVVNWSMLNIERTQAFLASRFPNTPLISVSETGVLGSPGVCVAESQLLPNLAAMVFEAIRGVETAYHARPPEYVSWLSMRRRDADEPATALPSDVEPPPPRLAGPPVFAPPPDAELLPEAPRVLAGLNVLWVDFRRDTQRTGANRLGELGAVVAVATDAELAFAYAQAKRYDAVLIDIAGADDIAFKLCRRITHDKTRKPPPVFVLAEKLRPMERARGAHAGTAGFLAWPVQRDALIAALSPLRAAAAAG